MVPSEDELQSFKNLRDLLLNVIREIKGGSLDSNTVDALDFRMDKFLVFCIFMWLMANKKMEMEMEMIGCKV